MNTNLSTSSDLTIIKGIGAARAHWLNAALEIVSLHDLAAASAGEIEARLKQDSLIASRREIEAWINQAQAVVALLPSAEADDTDSTQPDSFEPDVKWKPFASFVVELQAREGEKRISAHHIEADQSAAWDGIDYDSLVGWMMRQSGEIVAPAVSAPEVVNTPLPAAQPEAAPQSAPPLVAQITQIRTFQPLHASHPSGTAKPGQPFLGLIKGSEDFAIQALLEAPPDMALQDAAYSAQFYAVNTATGVTTHLGGSDPQPMTDAAQAARLNTAQLTKGLYRLRVYATITAPTPAAGYMEVPFVQVV